MKFSRTVPEQVTCRRCAAIYVYDRVFEVAREVAPGQEDAVAREAENMLDRQQTEPLVAVVRCPTCRKFGPGALRNRLLMTGVTLGGAAICAAVAVGLTLLAGATGQFFWVLALGAALAVPVLLLLALVALLSPTTHKTRLVGTGRD
jgi:hypothetical protein